MRTITRQTIRSQFVAYWQINFPIQLFQSLSSLNLRNLNRRSPVIALPLLLVTLVGRPVAAAVSEPVRSDRGMVTAAHPLATEAGLAMLKQGGNAVDAAVATAFAISVVEPYAAGIGGGGFLLLRLNQGNQIKALDFRERAPLKATRTMYLDGAGKPIPRASLDGHLAVGVPGTVAGLAEVHRRYGQLPWKQVVAPAIRYADRGFAVSDRFVRWSQLRLPVFTRNPAAGEIFTRKGQPFRTGDQLVQRDLATTLKAIAEDPRQFYTGSIGQAIAQDMSRKGGLISLQDLQAYRPIWRAPLCGSFRKTQICSMPPPSSGGVHLLQILNLIGDTDLAGMGWHSPDALQLLAAAMQIAYADRAVYLGDPDFVKVPVAALISPAYARLRRSEINLQQARSSQAVRAADPAVLNQLRLESPNTSHLTVVDPQRNTVSLTFTLNGPFGAGVVAAGTGIVLNNEMDDFAIAPDTPNLFGLVGREANAIAAGKTPLSSMTPVIATENGQLRMAAGSPGGSRIITTSLQLILNVLVYGLDASEAVAAPRIHHQWLPDQLLMERRGFDLLTVQELRRRGNPIQEVAPWGNANLIVVTPEGNLEGAADPRGEGSAAGF